MTSMTYLQNLREGFDDARIFIAIHLNDVDESDLCLGPITERFKDGCKFLEYSAQEFPGPDTGEKIKRTPTSRNARFSI